MLQVLALVWFYMISKVAYKVITGTGAEDTRSDDEDDEEAEEEDELERKNTDSIGVGAGTAVADAKKAESGFSSAGTSALSTLMMNGNGHSGSTHRHITSKLSGGDMH